MEATLILIKEYCLQCQVEETFIYALEEEGLIETLVISNDRYIEDSQLDSLEQFRRWHYDLHINVEGMDAMRHLLDKVKTMQKEIFQLRERLRVHEGIQ